MAQPEVHEPLRLRCVATAAAELAYQMLVTGCRGKCDPDDGADCIRVSWRPQQVERDPVAGATKSIQVDRWVCAVVVDDQVEASVAIQICCGNRAAVEDLSTACCASGLVEAVDAGVQEEAVVLVAVPRALSEEFLTEEEAVLVVLNACDRTARKR